MNATDSRSADMDGTRNKQEVGMERFSFGDDMAFVPGGDLLDGVTVAPLTQAFEEGALVQAAIFRFEPGGRLGRHSAPAIPEIFAVLEGSGVVSGANGVDEPIGAGEAVLWHEGDEQEMRAEAGLTVLIIQGESLDRFRGRPTAPSAPE